MKQQHILVLCACPDEATAAAIARTLVEERLAACVNRLAAVHSTYEWEGRINDEPEVLLTIKTTGACYQALEVRLKALHPYQVPEIIALPIVGGAKSYLEWLDRQSSPADRSSMGRDSES